MKKTLVLAALSSIAFPASEACAFQFNPVGSFGRGNDSYIRPDGSFGSTPTFEMASNVMFIGNRN